MDQKAELERAARQLNRDPIGFLLETLLAGLAARAGHAKGRYCPSCGKTANVEVGPCEACR